MNNLDIFAITPNNIWSYKQNHPELVINDLQIRGVSGEIIELVRISMLARGINKWLKVRRDLIAYKKIKKHQIKDKFQDIMRIKGELKKVPFKTVESYMLLKQLAVVKAELKLLEEVRSSLKALCMTERWQIWKNKDLEDMNTIRASD